MKLNQIWKEEKDDRWDVFNQSCFNFFSFEKSFFLLRWPPRYNDHFGTWKLLLNPIWVTEALHRPKKGLHIVLCVKFTQPYGQYSVRARASGGAVYPLFPDYDIFFCGSSIYSRASTHCWQKQNVWKRNRKFVAQT